MRRSPHHYGAAALAAAALLSITAVATAAPATAAATPLAGSEPAPRGGVGTASEGSSWISGDTYHQTVFNHHLKPSDSERWEGRCPSDFPYLDQRVVTAGMEGNTGVRGFTVQKESNWLAIGEGLFVRSYVPIPGSPGWKYVTGTAGTVTNWSVTHQHLRVDMTCTSNAAYAWSVY